MAQTKARNSRSSSSSGRARSRRNGSSNKSAKSKTAASGSRSRKSTQARRSSSQSRAPQKAQSQSTARTIAGKAKGPALAAGAAIVGVAGGMAMKNGRKRHGVLRRVPKPNMPKLKVGRPRINSDDALQAIGKAAGEVAQRSHRVGEVASGVQKASEAISNGKQ